MGDKIIITAPLPPPIHGMSLATSILMEGLAPDFIPIVIDTAMDKGGIAVTQPSIFAPKRFLKIIKSLFCDTFKMLTVNYKIHYLCTGLDFRGVVRYLPYIIVSRLKGKPYVIHIHNGAFRKMYDSLSKNRRRVIDFMFKNAAGVIVLGDSLRVLFEGVVPKEKIFVVENCVADEFVTTPKVIQEKLKRNRTAKYKILYLSNLMEDKGIIDLMNAVEHINNCELHLAGAIEERESTKVHVERMLELHKHRFTYYGRVEGEVKAALLRECDIFCLPSRNEGQPISILEAYANGLAVVTDPNVGGISDIFKDGTNGIACRCNDEKSIQLALQKCMERVNEFAEPNYEYAVSKFKKSDFISNIKNVFRAIK